MKIIIVGGGPSGSSTASSILAHSEAKVTIYTKNITMEPTRCGGAVNRFLGGKDFPSIPKNLIGSSIQKERLYSPDSNFVEVDSRTFGWKSLGFILHRNMFDRWLLNRAVKKGAEVIEEKVTLKKLKGLDYDVLVGADGVNSTVAKYVGRPNLNKDLHHGIQITVDWSYPRNMVSFYFGSKVFPEGYGWVFPCGEKTRIVLIVPLSNRLNLKKLLDRFLQQIGAPNEGELISKLIPMSKPQKTGVYGKTLLVGDTLPSCDPLWGEGIINAVKTGSMAGRAIAENKLRNYDVYLKSLLKENNLRYTLKNILYRLSDVELNKVIPALRTIQIQSVNTKVETLRVVSHLFLRQPRLMIKSLFAFFGGGLLES